MKAEDVMTKNVKSCLPETSLSQVTAHMWDCDCGALPVVDRAGKVVGMITDRDIAISVGTRGRLATEITVGEVMSGNVYCCVVDEDVKSAINTMRREKVRRLPVVGKDGKLEGIISIGDLALRAEAARGRQVPEISYEDVMSAFKDLCDRSKAFQAGAV